MANITDLIMQQVQKAAGNVEIPSNVQNTVLNGLSESILGSLTQTATKAGGIDMIKSLLTGKTNAAASPVTALAGKLFTSNILSKLNLGSLLNGKLTALIPTVLGGLSNIIKDQDGDGDVDLNDILLTLKGGKSSGILGAATSILGGLFKK
ncbi:MAG: hypothetical protein IJS70_09800 [Bacteroidales bacterium]|nr:hypothetical protein [Bacteroidales bacterium]MBQ6081893.1 hypothetical protein [Bacteroidales bacterium]MBQ7459449.1 hypothetical protein [Bacteroidales bacterium]MBQ9529642.1 hypothetical protein [Bacteroidales bacterium]